MNFKIEQIELKKILDIMANGINNKNLIDILKGIRIIAKNKKIKFTTSKSTMTINYETDKVDIISDGSVIVYGTQFLNIIKEMDNNSDILNCYMEDNLFVISNNNSTIKLITLPKTEYPESTLNSDGELKLINKKLFNIAFNKAKYTIAPNHTNNLLTAINMNFNKNNLLISSTDSKRLTYVTLNPVNNYENIFNIEKNLFNDLIKIFNNIEQEEIYISTDSTKLYIKTNELELIAKLIDGTYPNVQTLIPNEYTFSFDVESQDIYSTLHMMSTISEKDNSIVTLEYIENDIFINFFSKEFGEIENKLKIQNISGSPFKIAFDPLFVIDAINSISADVVKFSFTSETSAFKIEDPTDGNNIQIISPIRIS